MEIAFEQIAACFPLADLYARMGRQLPRPSLREPVAGFRAFPYSERHLQCVWSDPALRPASLVDHRGDEIVVENPGVWNLEAGPDFLGAALLVGREKRRIKGDVEIHIHSSDWQQHEHGGDPNYSRVIAHVTFFNAPLPENSLPRSCVQIALRDALVSNPLFAFENIDTTAYPYAARSEQPPCADEMRSFTVDQKTKLLDCAGEERLRRRAERIAVATAERGQEHVLYEEVMSALGFKNNKSPFRRLAEIVKLDALRKSAAGNVRAAYALLAGVAGLLPKNLRSDWDEETRRFVREIWDEWWKREDEWEELSLRRDQWKLSGMRPMNHPLRRLMVAAQIFVGANPMKWLDGGPDEFVAGLQRSSDPYWSFREGFSGKKSTKQIQLVGSERADAIAINVIAPFLAAIGKRNLFDDGLLDRLPVEGDNAIIRHAAHYLFGPDHPAKLYATARRRQGLQQIFQDFCLNDRSRCATCRFPALLRAFREGMSK